MATIGSNSPSRVLVKLEDSLLQEGPSDTRKELSLDSSNVEAGGKGPLENQPGFPLDFKMSTKNAKVTEKFILDLLSLPVSDSPPDEETVEANASPLTCENTDSAVEHSDPPRSWGQDEDEGFGHPVGTEGSEELSEVCQLPESAVPCSAYHAVSDPSDLFHSAKEHVSGDYAGASSGSCRKLDLKCSGKLTATTFKEVRSKRRREFHKIHTRRSRAKLNEKMDLLRRILPEPPSGIVVKSKAQIIDYAITVLAKLPLKELEPDWTLEQKEQ